MIGPYLIHLRTLTLVDEDGDAAGCYTKKIDPQSRYEEPDAFDDIIRDLNYDTEDDADIEELFDQMDDAGMKWDWHDSIWMIWIDEEGNVEMEELGRL